MQPMKFRKKPVVIEAIQYHENMEVADIIVWITATSHSCSADIEDDGSLKIKTLEGTMNVSLGDWVIKGVENEFYPCKPEIFNKTYEAE